MKPAPKPPRYADVDAFPRVKGKGEPYRHIIAGAKDGNRVWFLHATKGWRTEAER